MSPRRKGTDTKRIHDYLSLSALCALLIGSATLHLLDPAPYRLIIPVPLRAFAAALVAISGVVEFCCACLLAVPRTRRIGAYLTAVLFVVVFPANVQMALDSGRPHVSGWMNDPLIAWLRLSLQVPLFLWAWSFRRPTDSSETQ